MLKLLECRGILRLRRIHQLDSGITRTSRDSFSEHNEHAAAHRTLRIKQQTVTFKIFHFTRRMRPIE